MNTGAGVRSIRVLTAGVIVTVRAQSALIYIWTMKTFMQRNALVKSRIHLTCCYLTVYNMHFRCSEFRFWYPDRPVDVLPTCRCCCSAPWSLPAGRSLDYTDRPQSCQPESLSPETSRSPEDVVVHTTLLQHTEKAHTHTRLLFI